MCVYGHRREAYEFAFLRASFPGYAIVDPAKHTASDMAFYRALVQKCEGLVFTRLFGKITAGVGDEVNFALKLGKPVFELKAWDPETPDWDLVSVGRPVRHVSREASVALYRRFERLEKLCTEEPIEDHGPALG
jgi:hypothetical protein